jgi:hypothetical protein
LVWQHLVLLNQLILQRYFRLRLDKLALQLFATLRYMPQLHVRLHLSDVRYERGITPES